MSDLAVPTKLVKNNRCFHVIFPCRNIMKMALTMARATAIRRGTPLSVAEMEHILASLLSLPDPAYTPNGNPIFCILKESTLDHQFER